jgi:hypothetical protein
MNEGPANDPFALGRERPALYMINGQHFQWTALGAIIAIMKRRD